MLEWTNSYFWFLQSSIFWSLWYSYRIMWAIRKKLQDGILSQLWNLLELISSLWWNRLIVISDFCCLPLSETYDTLMEECKWLKKYTMGSFVNFGTCLNFSLDVVGWTYSYFCFFLSFIVRNLRYIYGRRRNLQWQFWILL